MSDQRGILGKNYQELYDNYYLDSPRTVLKRKISAEQTMEYLRGVVGDRVIGKLLDVGAGDGNVLLELHERRLAGELYAVEISASGVEAIRAKALSSVCEAKLFDGYKIPYPDKYFDLAIAVHVLEHVEHERLFLQEIKRVSKSVYIEVPLEHGLRVRRSIGNGKAYGHINFYTIDTLRGVLESSGLVVRKCRVMPSSLKYESHLSGRALGWIKNGIRAAALAVAPGLAPWLMVYNGFALCDCTEQK